MQNKKLEMDVFLKEREQVLSTWKTGKEVEELEQGIAYAKALPKHKNFALKMEDAKNRGQLLTQPRAGVALIEDHIDLLRTLQDDGRADVLPSTIDSYTRQNRYEECERGIKESTLMRRSMLNGFPAVNHGVAGCRRVLESVDRPLQARHGTPDARLLAEIIHASGWTSNEGGGISYNIPYSKNVPLEKSVRDWMYIDRLAAIYEEHGVPINREPFGPLTGTLVPPSMCLAIGICEALLAAEQGVKSLTLGYGQCGNQIQDIAAIAALRELAEEYMSRYGYHDTVITTVFHQWMGGFPQDEPRAFAIISYASITAALARATKVIVKTPHEAFGVPTKEANVAGLTATRMAIRLLEGQNEPNSYELDVEKMIIKSETRCIVDAVFKAGNGDLAQGVVEAFKRGILDVPFAPSKGNLGAMMPVRDNKGAIRYLNMGNVPLSNDLVIYNREKIQERAKYEGRQVSFDMTVDDIFAVGKGKLIGRPEHITEQFKGGNLK